MAIRTAAPDTGPLAGHDAPPVTDDLHPALDASIEPAEPRGAGLDKVVFGVTALIAIGFRQFGHWIGWLTDDSRASARLAGG